MNTLVCSNDPCQKTFTRNVSTISKSASGKFYCSRACAATKNNTLHPKRIRLGCRRCQVSISHLPKSSLLCEECNSQKVDWTTITLNDCVSKRKYQRYSRIRTASRRIYLSSNRPKYCMVSGCGYSKHFDVCHVKAIKDHLPSDTVATINSLDNLIALCKNHHWEFDNGLLDMSDIIKD